MYDPKWLDGKLEGGGDFLGGFALVMAHEVGHHLCEHTTTGRRGVDVELEADRAAGALMATVQWKSDTSGYGVMTRPDSVGALWERLTQIAQSETHPARQARIRAVIQGYKEGSACVKAPSTWIHEEKPVHVLELGTSRQIYLYQPKGLDVPGNVGSDGQPLFWARTTLFFGKIAGSRLVGKTYTWDGMDGCTGKEFEIEGRVSDNEREIRLSGKEPQYAKRKKKLGGGYETDECYVSGYKDVERVFIRP